jgi:hypothetical protein
MPGDVSNAVPTAVMPFALCRAFRRSQTYKVRLNEYPDGTAQRDLEVANSRKMWQLTLAASPALLATLRDFFINQGQRAFYFYDVWETVPKFHHDPTGVAAAGRYTCVFRGEWSQESFGCKCYADVEIVEVG